MQNQEAGEEDEPDEVFANRPKAVEFNPDPAGERPMSDSQPDDEQQRSTNK